MTEGLWSAKSVLDMVIREIVFIGSSRAADDSDDDLFEAKRENTTEVSLKLQYIPAGILELKITCQELSLHHGQVGHNRANITILTHCSSTYYLVSNKF